MVYEAFNECSKPLTYDQISRALFTVITKNNSKITPANAKQAVDKIMEINVRRSEEYFKEGATNVFSQIHNNIQLSQQEIIK